MRRLLFVIAGIIVILPAQEFHPGAVDPPSAGMSSTRVGRIPRRMQEFIDAGKAAGAGRCCASAISTHFAA